MDVLQDGANAAMSAKDADIVMGWWTSVARPKKGARYYGGLEDVSGKNEKGRRSAKLQKWSEHEAEVKQKTGTGDHHQLSFWRNLPLWNARMP